MDGSALIRTFLIFFAGGLLLTAAAISVFLIGSMVWLYCLDGNANQACGDALFYGVASPIYGVIIGMGINFLPLAVGAVLAVIGRKLFRSLPLWYVVATLPACALAYLAQTSSWYPQDHGRPLSERLLVFSVLQMLCLLICWWWDRRE
jgi:hypothetical protein